MDRRAAAVVIVPARRDSTRLPGKLLLAESGRPLLAHTLERCLAARAPGCVAAAVDGPELAQVARDCGALALLTDPALPSGSDRVWAAAAQLPDARWIVNVQGDEPEIDPAAIDAVFGALAAGAEVATLSAPWPEQLRPAEPSAVKVVTGLDGRALYFSRAPIPFPRRAGVPQRLHVGVYGYTRAALRGFAGWPASPLELTEGLEQLRFLEHGVAVTVVEWPSAFSGIDTRADYDAFLGRRAHLA